MLLKLLVVGLAVVQAIVALAIVVTGVTLLTGGLAAKADIDSGIDLKLVSAVEKALRLRCKSAGRARRAAAQAGGGIPPGAAGAVAAAMNASAGATGGKLTHIIGDAKQEMEQEANRVQKEVVDKYKGELCKLAANVNGRIKSDTSSLHNVATMACAIAAAVCAIYAGVIIGGGACTATIGAFFSTTCLLVHAAGALAASVSLPLLATLPLALGALLRLLKQESMSDSALGAGAAALLSPIVLVPSAIVCQHMAYGRLKKSAAKAEAAGDVSAASGTGTNDVSTGKSAGGKDDAKAQPEAWREGGARATSVDGSIGPPETVGDSTMAGEPSAVKSPAPVSAKQPWQPETGLTLESRQQAAMSRQRDAGSLAASNTARGTLIGTLEATKTGAESSKDK